MEKIIRMFQKVTMENILWGGMLIGGLLSIILYSVRIYNPEINVAYPILFNTFQLLFLSVYIAKTSFH